jgi:hypothetical protein
MQEKNIVNRYRPLILVNLIPEVLLAGLTQTMILGYAFLIIENEVFRNFRLARPD